MNARREVQLEDGGKEHDQGNIEGEAITGFTAVY